MGGKSNRKEHPRAAGQMKHSNICAIGIPGEEERETGSVSILFLLRICPALLRDLNYVGNEPSHALLICVCGIVSLGI